MTDTSSCPSSFALQRFALCPDEASESVEQHVGGCTTCQHFVREQRAQGDAYMNSPRAEALRQALDTATERRTDGGSSSVWAWSGALAVAASLALVLSLTGLEGILGGGQTVSTTDDVDSVEPNGDALQPKGSVQLALWVEDETKAGIQLGEPALLRPGQRVQPTFGAADDGFVALLLTTPGGVVVPLYPAGREQSAPYKAGPSAPLGPSFRLDDEVGAYRVTAYFAASSFSTKELQSGEPKPEARSFSGVISTRKFEVRP